jgi:two-component system sensor histidine kinase YesM
MLRTLQNQIILLVFAFLIPPLLAFYFSMQYQYNKTWNGQLSSILESRIKQNNANFQSVLSGLIYTTNMVVMDRELMDSIDRYNKGLSSHYNPYGQIIDRLSGLAMINLKLNTIITVQDNKGNIYKTWSGRIMEAPLKNAFTEYQERLQKKGDNILWDVGPVQFVSPSDSGGTYLSVIRPFTNPDSSKNIGMVMISVTILDILRNYYGEINNKTECFFIMDDQKRILLQTQLANSIIDRPEMAFAVISHGRTDPFIRLGKSSYSLIIKDIINYHLHLTSCLMVSYDELNGDLRNIQTTFFIQAVLTVAIAVMILYVIAKKISAPIMRLSRHMERVYNNSILESYPNEGGVMEIRQLIKSYNVLVQSIKEYTEKIKKTEQEKNEANFQSLQAQINPHFLFNTLNTIKWVCYMNKDQQSGDLIMSLGRLYEIAMNRESDYITIRDELEFLHNYITLIKIRYKMDFQVDFDYEQSLLDKLILKFLIQPVMENSIIHGFKGNLHHPNNRLKLNIGQRENKLHISIIDNGCGFDAKKLEPIETGHQSERREKFSGIGLHNVIKRVENHYGSGYGVEINSSPSEGTKIYMLLPVITEEDEDFDSDDYCR